MKDDPSNKNNLKIKQNFIEDIKNKLPTLIMLYLYFWKIIMSKILKN